MAQPTATFLDSELGIRFKPVSRTNLLTTKVSNAGARGEPHWIPATGQLFIHDGTVVQPVQTLDMAVIKYGEVVTKNDKIVYKF